MLALSAAELAPPPGAPALAVGAILRDRVILLQASGSVADADGLPTPTDASDTIFSCASISKLVLCVVALQCAERGELDLDADVSALLPGECRLRNPAHPSAAVSARCLLRHESGLCDGEEALARGPWRSEGCDCPVALATYVAARLSGDPGGLWHASPPGAAPYHYSNLGMTCLALCLERACGGVKSFADLARERVFSVLGMSRSSFRLAEAVAQRGSRAAPHGADGAPLAPFGVAEYPAANLRSTAADLLHFLSAFTGEPGVCPLLRAASLAQALPSDGVRGLAWWGADATYGEKDNTALVWTHGGFMEGIRSHLYYYPKQRLGLILLQNGEAPYDALALALHRVVAAAAAELDADGDLDLPAIVRRR